ncbi:hypothetical protein [Ensifer sp. ENS11]|uniref:hypothetical protein n=1 Tax=Ensifer sp. ENS11 TaxID=2769291 RepID=UPI001781E182|nr:hypothetical protein [Ensifer sp. ENS11]MBD9490510.1 hypothetical protein [Ensifer sp. ENS11]MDP9633046.1 hypothetical protein [Ensifer adhaerens]
MTIHYSSKPSQTKGLNKESLLMIELFNWFGAQPGGVGSYRKFEENALELALDLPEHAASLRLLADIAARFVETYADQPLPAGVADAAFKKMTSIVEIISASKDSSVEERLAALNAIAVQNIV